MSGVGSGVRLQVPVSKWGAIVATNEWEGGLHRRRGYWDGTTGDYRRVGSHRSYK